MFLLPEPNLVSPLFRMLTGGLEDRSVSEFYSAKTEGNIAVGPETTDSIGKFVLRLRNYSLSLCG
jgi:hypothetical protein